MRITFILAAVFVFAACGTEMERVSLQKRFDAAVRPADIHEAVLYIENSSGDFSESFGYGGRDIDTPMLTASVGKLFTTACVLILYQEGRLSLEDKLSLHFEEEQLRGLHVFKGREYSFNLTVYDLLFQTSGLPAGSGSLADEDKYVGFAQRLAETKTFAPKFVPKAGAYYANINFFMLGEILEKVTGMSLTDVYEKMVFMPLGMADSYLITCESDYIPYFYNGTEKLYRPQRLASVWATGGFVSTPRDLMVFSKGFWEGRLFDRALLEKLAVYRKLKPYFGPVHYGGGFMQIPLIGGGELLGHSGVTGSFAFYYPQEDLHFVGDFSQLKKPAAPFGMLMRLSR